MQTQRWLDSELMKDLVRLRLDMACATTLAEAEQTDLWKLTTALMRAIDRGEGA